MTASSPHRRLDNHVDFFLLTKHLAQLLPHFSARDLDVILRLSTFHVKEREESISCNIKQQILLLAYRWHFNSAVAWCNVVILFASEDVDGGDIDLGVAVLARFGDRELDNLGRAGLVQDDVAAFAKSGGLRGGGEGGTCVGGVEGIFFGLIFSGHLRYLSCYSSIRLLILGDIHFCGCWQTIVC